MKASLQRILEQLLSFVSLLNTSMNISNQIHCSEKFLSEKKYKYLSLPSDDIDKYFHFEEFNLLAFISPLNLPREKLSTDTENADKTNQHVNTFFH